MSFPSTPFDFASVLAVAHPRRRPSSSPLAVANATVFRHHHRLLIIATAFRHRHRLVSSTRRHSLTSTPIHRHRRFSRSCFLARFSIARERGLSHTITLNLILGTSLSNSNADAVSALQLAELSPHYYDTLILRALIGRSRCARTSDSHKIPPGWPYLYNLSRLKVRLKLA